MVKQSLAYNSHWKYRGERREIQNEKKKIHDLAKKLEKNLILQSEWHFYDAQGNVKGKWSRENIILNGQ